MGDTHLEALLAEAEMLVDIRHDNCIRFYGITAADDGAYGLVTEYMRGGNLAAAIHTPKKAAELRYESTAAQGELKGYWGDVDGVAKSACLGVGVNIRLETVDRPPRFPAADAASVSGCVSLSTWSTACGTCTPPRWSTPTSSRQTCFFHRRRWHGRAPNWPTLVSPPLSAAALLVWFLFCF